MLRDYIAGMTPREIADKYKRDAGTVQRLLDREDGLQKREKARRKALRLAEIDGEKLITEQVQILELARNRLAKQLQNMKGTGTGVPDPYVIDKLIWVGREMSRLLGVGVPENQTVIMGQNVQVNFDGQIKDPAKMTDEEIEAALQALKEKAGGPRLIEAEVAQPEDQEAEDGTAEED